MTTISFDRTEAGTGLAGLAFAAVGAIFMTVIMLGSSIAPGYDVAGGAISDLGITPATAALFNGTLLTVGVLNIAGGLLLFRALPRIDLPIVALLAGLGAIGAGLFPLVFSAIGHGGSERMIVYPPMIWLMIFGGSLMGH